MVSLRLTAASERCFRWFGPKEMKRITTHPNLSKITLAIVCNPPIITLEAKGAEQRGPY